MMTRTLITALIAGSLMVVSGAGAKYLKPTQLMSSGRPAAQTLERMIPTSFGDWKEEKIQVGTIVDPQIAEQLRAIYTQIVTRTYVNSRGERVMLSVAYGKDQSDSTQVHYPEICYPAQGFQLTANDTAMLAIGDKTIPVRRLQANLQQQRYEPITYWTTVGDTVVTNKVDKKLAEMRYNVKGTIPDGLLFRVSSIDQDTAAAYRVQDEFVRQMARALDPAAKLRLMGLAQ
jgi:EpsI family protein